MTRTLLAAAAALALLTSCASPDPAADPAAATASAPASTTPGAGSAEMSSAVAAAGIPPKPDEATARVYLDQLRAIDPAIVDEDNTDKAINRGRDQCKSVRDTPTDHARLVELTNRRFIAPGHSDGFGPQKAERILAAVRQHLCPTY